MKKKYWGNAVWLLFHTLAEKLKSEYTSEIDVLIFHISSICNNLPCPDCQKHASKIMTQVNKASINTSREVFIEFLWKFHNEVNRRTKAAVFPQEALNKYKTANTPNVVHNFIKVMSATANNEKTMLHGFHRSIYMKQFVLYISKNTHKFNI